MSEVKKSKKSVLGQALKIKKGKGKDKKPSPGLPYSPGDKPKKLKAGPNPKPSRPGKAGSKQDMRRAQQGATKRSLRNQATRRSRK